jgi:outer membrane protein insertion porin family
MSVTAALQRAWAAHRAELPRAGEATELLALLAVARSVAGDLQALDLFDSIDASVLPSSSSSGPEEVDLLFTLREKSRVLLKSSTDVGNGEGSASIQGRVRNCFGGAECLEGNATVGTRTRRSFNVSWCACSVESERAQERERREAGQSERGEAASPRWT